MLRISEPTAMPLATMSPHLEAEVAAANRAGRAGRAWRPAWTAVAVGLIALPPLGVLLLWFSEESSWQEKWTLTGIATALLGAYAIIGSAITHL